MCNRNWKEYNKKLVKRGSITFLIEENSFKNLAVKKKKSRGRPTEYSLDLIRIVLLCKIHYRLTYRSIEGFSKSLFPKFGCDLQLPTYTLLQKRASSIPLPLLPRAGSTVILLDSSGLKIYGEGEWKRKIHGASYRRKWRKLHIAVDLDSGDIVASELTKSNFHDVKAVAPLLDQVRGRVKTVLADGAYDGARMQIELRGAKAIIPPPRNARFKKNGSSRDQSILEIFKLGGDEIARSVWGKLTGYSKRVLVETAFSRIKRLHGGNLFSKIFKNQKVEAALRCELINKMNRISV